MSAIDEVADRIEARLKAADTSGMDIRITMGRAAAGEYVQQLRLVSRLVQEHDLFRSVLESARANLVRAGFVGRSEHGSGDPEINEIDDALVGEPAALTTGNRQDG